MKSILRYCEKNYFSDLLNGHSWHIKETWKILNSFTNTRSIQCTSTSMPFYYNGKVIDNKQAVANAFNDYFINIAHRPGLAIKQNKYMLMAPSGLGHHNFTINWIYFS